MPNAQVICGANELERKRIRRAAEANLRLERKLAQRLHPVEVCRCIPSATVQESFAHPSLEGGQASKSAGVVAPASGAASAQDEPQATQSVQSGLLP